MKKMGKLFSVLLSAALVAQMGVVIGMGSGSGCRSESHGMNGNKVDSAAECLTVPHWLAGQSMVGGTGRNYYYPTSGTFEIQCGAGANVIIFSSDLPSEMVVTGFGASDQDAIFVTDNATKETLHYSHDGYNGLIVRILGEMEEEIAKFPGGPEDLNIQLRPEPPKPSIKVNKQTVTVEPANSEYFYLWSRKDISKENSVETPLDVSTSTSAVEVDQSNLGQWTYSCTVVDKAGQVSGPVSTEVIVGCHVVPGLGTMKIDGADLVDGAVLNTAEAKTYTLTIQEKYPGKCSVENHGNINHDYIVTWNVTEGADKVRLTGDKLTLDPKNLSEAGDPVTITATLKKDGSTEVVKKTATIMVGKPAAPSVPESVESGPSSSQTDNSESSSNSSDEGNTSSNGISGGQENSSSGNDNSSSGGSSSDKDAGNSSDNGSNSGNAGTESSSSTSASESSSSSTSTSESSSSSTSTPESSSSSTSTPESSSTPTSTPESSSGSSSQPEPGTSSTPPEEPSSPSSQPESPSSQTTDPVPSCAKEPAAVTISGGTDRINEKTGKAVQYRAEIDFGDAACNLPEHQNGTVKDHGYIVGWSLSGGNGYAAVDGTGKVTITPENLPATETKVILAATLIKEARTVVTTATREITFVQSAGCNQEVAVNVKPASPTLLFTADDIKDNTTKEVRLTAELLSRGGCDIHDHNKVDWAIEKTDWAHMEEDPNNNKQVIISVFPRQLPKQKDNQVKVTASVLSRDGKAVTEVVTLSVDRVMMCAKQVKTVTISGEKNLSVPKNRVVSTRYTASKTYSGICDETGHDDEKGHNETATSWTLSDDHNGAFTIEQDGRLVITGSKLNEGYNIVTVIAAAGGQTETYDVTVLSTAAVADSSSDDSSDREWENLEDKLDNAKKGDTVKMNLGDDADVPFYIFDAVRGQDVNLVMTVSGGYTWTVNGKSVKKFPNYQIYIPLDIEKYTNSKMEKLCRGSDVRSFRLRHQGSFFADMKLTMDLGQGRASKVLYLYSYDEDQNRLTYCSSAKADGYGNVSFVLTKSLGAYVVTSKALYGENPVSSGGGAVGGGNITAIYPPVAPAPATPAPSSSGTSASESSSNSENSSESSETPPPSMPASEPPVQPTDTPVKSENPTLPVLVPVLVLCIAGVITATALIVRGSRGKMETGEI